jgi:hypothetical protein
MPGRLLTLRAKPDYRLDPEHWKISASHMVNFAAKTDFLSG